MSQTRTHQLEGRKREERVGELRNVAGHKRGLTNWRGGRGRSGLVSLETWEIKNEGGLGGGEGGGGGGWGREEEERTEREEDRGGRSGLESSETWNVANEDSPTGGEDEGGVHS